ncbi:uncharacterized protein [Antedon mediterranea]|uniref:uncharacterized protein n=1 Tax=Antedon mediterranea TaxID=105859 RepID=UPI003AF6232F
MTKSSQDDMDLIADIVLTKAIGPRDLHNAYIKVNQKLQDIAFNQIPSIDYHKYGTGSCFEGVPLPFCGDQDYMYNFSHCPVVLWPFEPARKYHKGGYLIAEQSPNEPAFFTLKVNSNWPLDESLKNGVDKNGYFRTNALQTIDVSKLKNVRKHGPAFELTHNYRTTDLILCLKCQSWPFLLKNCFTRKMSKLACLFVGTEPPTSKSKEMEWRLSFSLAERELCLELAEPFVKCMCALKAIKNLYVFRKPAPFCSYFIKTACFWMCETSLNSISTMDLIRKTLDWLIKCYLHGNLPHYFISKQNLIGHIKKTRCEEVITLLNAVKQHLWSNVMSGIEVAVDFLPVFRGSLKLSLSNYSELESVLRNSRDSRIKEIPLELRNMSDKALQLLRLTTMHFDGFDRIFQNEIEQNTFNHLETLKLKLDDMIESVLQSDDKIVPSDYEHILRHSLYCSLADSYTGFLKYLQANGRHDLNGYLNKPLDYYEKGSELVYPDRWSDQHHIGTKINVIKHYYLMNDVQKLKEMLAKFEPVLNEVKRNKGVMTRLRKVLIGLTIMTFDHFSWQNIDMDIFGLAAKMTLSPFLNINPIVFILYVNAKISLKEKDIHRAFGYLNEMKSSLTVIQEADHEVTQYLIKTIEWHFLYTFWFAFRTLF